MKSNGSPPQQKKGASTDITESIVLRSTAEAIHHFEIVKQRLLNVSAWDKISMDSPAEFQLTDPSGKAIARDAREGDFFKIKIPAPGPKAGGGYDWVQVQSVKTETDAGREEEYLAMIVKPAKDPTSTDSAPAHFFNTDASSTFIVTRKGKEVTAEVHGRNETPNTQNTGIADTLRNSVVALGAMLGFSDLQWKALVKGLVAAE